MTPEKMDTVRDDDGRHDFTSATVSADDDQIRDDRGHEFTHGRVTDRDEYENQ